MLRSTFPWLVAVCLFFVCAATLPAAQNDWAEGTPGVANGASRDCYNRAGLLKWKNYMGDWRDADNVPQGKQAFATTTLVDDDKPKWIEWDVTGLVQQWVAGKSQNQGFFLRATEGTGTFKFASRESAEADKRPQLILATGDSTRTLAPEADTHLEPSTYRSVGQSETLTVAMGSCNVLLRFGLSGVDKHARIDKAMLRLYCVQQYGNGSMTAGVFRCCQGHDAPPSEPVRGLAWKYPGDRGIERDPNVIFATRFESPQWQDEWTFARGALDPVMADAPRKFEPLAGKALRVKIAEGATGAMNVGYKFQKQIGREPEEIYFRYYLRLADDWNQTVQGGKLPGIAGTYGVAGWGGRKSDGTDGWSARGSFHLTIPDDNPLAGTTPIGTYCYHADMEGTYGDIWLWQEGYRGFLENNRWYCVEQYLKMNTPGKKDGILRAWIDGRPAFEKTDIRFRLVDKLKIEEVWMNVYHGGTRPSPYDQHLYVDNVVIARNYIGPMNADFRGR